MSPEDTPPDKLMGVKLADLQMGEGDDDYLVALAADLPLTLTQQQLLGRALHDARLARMLVIVLNLWRERALAAETTHS